MPDAPDLEAIIQEDDRFERWVDSAGMVLWWHPDMEHAEEARDRHALWMVTAQAYQLRLKERRADG